MPRNNHFPPPKEPPQPIFKKWLENLEQRLLMHNPRIFKNPLHPSSILDFLDIFEPWCGIRDEGVEARAQGGHVPSVVDAEKEGLAQGCIFVYAITSSQSTFSLSHR